jgi:hypothetical protein
LCCLPVSHMRQYDINLSYLSGCSVSYKNPVTLDT